MPSCRICIILILREVQEKFKNYLFINITLKQQHMKKILFILVMLVSAVGLTQEKTYKVVNEKTVAVTIKFDGAPTQKGMLTNVDGMFKPHGIWTQYDENNRVTLRVMYLEGKKVWVEKDLGATQVVINYKEGAI